VTIFLNEAKKGNSHAKSISTKGEIMADEEKLTGGRPSAKGSSRTGMVILLAATAVVIFMCAGLPYMTHQWASQYTKEKEIGNGVVAETPVLEIPTLHSDGRLEVCIRNPGSVAIQIDTVYKNGKFVATELNQEVSSGNTACFTLPGTYAPDDEVTLVTKKGTQIKFEVQG